MMKVEKFDIDEMQQCTPHNVDIKLNIEDVMKLANNHPNIAYNFEIVSQIVAEYFYMVKTV